MIMNSSVVLFAFLILSFHWASAVETKIETAICNPNVSAEPVCTPDEKPTAKTDNVRICFGAHHPRCFELKGSDYVQTINGLSTVAVKLSVKEQTRIKEAVQTYKNYLKEELGKIRPSALPCRDAVSIRSRTSGADPNSEELCAGLLNSKAAAEKKEKILQTLASPKSFTSKKESN
jgi:hypothetical protein